MLQLKNKLNNNLLQENVTHFKKITKIIPCVTLYEISQQFTNKESVEVGCRGSLFFFERNIKPTNGIFIFNKLNQKNFVYLITKETEIHVDGNYMYLHTSLEKYKHSDFLFLIHFVKSEDHEETKQQVLEFIQYAKDKNEGVELFIRERRNMCTVPTSQTKLNIVDMLHQAKLQKDSSVKPLSEFKETINFNPKQHTEKNYPTVQKLQSVNYDECKKTGEKIDLNVLFSPSCKLDEEINFEASYSSRSNSMYCKHASVKKIELNQEKSIVKLDSIDKKDSKTIKLQKEVLKTYPCKKRENLNIINENSQFMSINEIATPCTLNTSENQNQNELSIDMKLKAEGYSRKKLLPPSYFSKNNEFKLNFFELPIITDQGVEVFTDSFISLLKKNEQFRNEMFLLWQRNTEDRKKGL